MANGKWLMAKKTAPEGMELTLRRIRHCQQKVPLTGGGFRGWVTYGNQPK